MFARSNRGVMVGDGLHLRVAIVAGLAYALLAACGSESALIIGGVQDNDHVNVVQISSGLGACTGTFLGSGLVLTAAHCVPAPSFGTTAVSVTFVDYIGNKNTTLSSISYTALPVSLNARQDETNDLATVLIEDCRVPAGITGMPVLDSTAGVLGNGDIGSDLTAVGFGATTAPTVDDPYGSGSGMRHRGSVTLGSLTSYTAQVSEGGDHAAPCHGDSGGPLLVTRGGTEYLAGVVSTGDCETETTYARTDNNRNASFIDESAAAASSSLDACDGGSPTRGCTAGSPSGFAPVVLGVAAILRRRRRRAASPAGSRCRERADGQVLPIGRTCSPVDGDATQSSRFSLRIR